VATTKFRMVQGDTAPSLQLVITDKATAAPVDLSGSTVLVKFRAVGSEVVKATMSCDLLTGYVEEDGTIITAPPYDIAGAGGRLQMNWTADALDTPGEFEAEVEATFSNGRIQTAYDLLKFTVRPQF
jgi:hypothetical protein